MKILRGKCMTLQEINISKFSFSKIVYRPLNKHLNFVPTGNVHNKTQPKYGLNSYF